MGGMATAENVLIPPKLYRIGELSHHTGLTRQTLHNYTTMGLIKEVQWSKGGHRLYDETVFYRLQKIADLKNSKTMCEIRCVLENTEV